MKKEQYNILMDEDNLVIFDESDDFVPGEAQILDKDDELDMEYLLRETARQEAEQEKELQSQRWMSVGVISAVIAFIVGLCYIIFRNI